MTQHPLQYRHFGAYRLLLAALVMGQHFVANLAPASVAASFQPLEIGSVAVLAFFALSGFVIAEAVDRIYADRPGAFLGNRLLRIVPHFLLAVAITILVCAAFRHLGTLRIERGGPDLAETAFSTRNIVLNTLSFLPLGDRVLTHNFLELAWAIRVEMMFYVAVFGGLAVVPFAGRKLRVTGFDALGAALLCIGVPLFGLAELGRAPSMFQFAPYFAFGWSLYGAVTRRSRTAPMIVVLSLAGIAAQFLSQGSRHPTLGFERDVAAQCLILAALLGLMAVLAAVRLRGSVKLDRRLGDLTYPLYLYHQAVMIVLLSATTGYSYGVLGFGFVAAIVVAAGLGALVDPIVDRWRDAIRGRRLERTDPVGQPPVVLADAVALPRRG